MATDAANGGTGISIWNATDSKCILDYKDADKGGGINPDLTLLPGETYTITLYCRKALNEAYVTVYINGVKVIEGHLPTIGTGTGVGVRSLNSEMQYDNLVVTSVPQTYPDGSAVGDVVLNITPVSSITVRSSAADVKENESVTFTATISPSDATPISIKWYVNDVLVDGADTLTLVLTRTEGTYNVRVEIDGIVSNVKTLKVTKDVVTPDPPKPTETKDLSWIYWTIGAVVVLSAVGITAVVIIKKHK